MKLNVYSILRRALPLAALVLLGACKQDVDKGGFTPSEPQISFGSDSPLEADKNGASYELTLSSNLPWRVESGVDWIIIDDPTFGVTGDDNITIRINVAKNPVERPREGSITAWITDDSRQVFVITQPAGDPPPPRNVYVKPDGTGTGDSWSDAISLDSALVMDLYPKDTLRLAAGTYSPTVTITGGNASAAADYTFEIKRNMSIVGGYPADPADGAVSDPATNATILDGGNTSNHVITVTASRIEGQKVLLKGVSIRNGQAAGVGNVTINGLAYNQTYGGGMIVARADVELQDCVFKDNVSVNGGGAFYGFTSASITLSNCVVDSNISTASGANGGAIVVDKQSSLTINNSSIVNNAAGSFAGAMYVYTSSLYMYNTTVSNNSSGGAGSTTANKNYGAVYIREGAGALVNCTLHGNTSSQSGGAIGLYGTAAAPTTFYVVSSTITGNKVKHASSGGAAMHINSASANCSVYVINSILSGNTRGATGTETASDVTGVAGFAVNRSNMVEATQTYDNNGAVIAAAPAFDYQTMLGTLTDNGGATQTVKLTGSGNPAMSYGMNATQLITLGATLPGQPGAAVMGVDQTGTDRGTMTYMGACVK